MNSRNEHVIEGLHLLIEWMERKMGGLREAIGIYEATLKKRTDEQLALQEELRIANDTLLEKAAEQYKEYIEDTTQRENVPCIYWALLGMRELLNSVQVTDTEEAMKNTVQRVLRIVPIDEFHEYSEKYPYVLPRKPCDKGD